MSDAAQSDVPSGDAHLATPLEAERRLRETKPIPAYLANEVPVAAADVAAQDLAPSSYVYAEGTRLMTWISLERVIRARAVTWQNPDSRH